MFEPEVYQARRNALRARLQGGLVLVMGAQEASTNYRSNVYPFVQDGSFAYFFGLRLPNLIGLIDLDAGEDWLFGTDVDLESLIWNGPLPSLADRAASIGVYRNGSPAALSDRLRIAALQGRCIHYTPPYRGRAVLQLSELLDRPPSAVRTGASEALIHAIVAQREIKDDGEIAQIEAALAVTDEMHRAAMAATRPGVFEREVVAEMERVLRRRDWQPAYPIIFSKRGEILHCQDYSNRLEAGDIVINDSGTSSGMGYASDITRTLPVSGQFSDRQRQLYELVLASQDAAITAIRPGTPFIDLHKLAMKTLVDGLTGLEIFRGDPWEIVETGAYAIVCQAGLGHQLGLDVHDMEGLGEDFVGYDETVSRSNLFGMNRLRMAKRLKPGMVTTVEPGLYFIPALIESWAQQSRFVDFINYDRLRTYVGVGGLRVEDDVLTTASGSRILGPHIPRTADEIEVAMAAKPANRA
jgi:Xaa-Pro aminopeptidase